MPSGRLENENKEFNKIEEQLKDLPNIFSEYYYAMRAEKKSYRTIQEYLKKNPGEIASLIRCKANHFKYNLTEKDIKNILMYDFSIVHYGSCNGRQ